MPRFKWIEWNLDKIAAHQLSCQEVEHAFEHRIGPHQEREDESYETIGVTPSGRANMIIWRYDTEFEASAVDQAIEVIFVITAY